MAKTRGKLLVAAFFWVWVIETVPYSSAEQHGSIELAEANALLKAYAAYMVDQQPREFRKAWKKQLPQVRFNQAGLYALTGVDGRIVFEYLPKSKTLHCLSVIHSFRGVVRPWVFRALQEAAASGTSTSGAELIYDPVSTAIFARKTFVESPVRKKDFIRTCDRVMKTGEHWRSEHFLPALNAFYARNAPPDSATAESEGFRATLVLTEDETAFQDLWDRPPTAREPAIWTLDRVTPGGPVHAFVLFSGCAPNSEGLCALTASLEILRSSGSAVATVPDITLWNGPPPPAGHLQMAEQGMKISFNAEEPFGTYIVRAKVCNKGTQRCVELSVPLELVGQRP